MFVRRPPRRLAPAACALRIAVATAREATAAAIVTAYARDIISNIRVTTRFDHNISATRRNETIAADSATLRSVNNGIRFADRDSSNPRTVALGPGANALPRRNQPKQFRLFNPHQAEGDSAVVLNVPNLPSALKGQGLINLSAPDSGSGGGVQVLQYSF
jgi:hypothetical protein